MVNIWFGAGLLHKKKVNLSTHPSSLSIWFTLHTLAPHTPSYSEFWSILFYFYVIYTHFADIQQIKSTE